MKRVLFQWSNGDIRNTNTKIIDRFCQVFGVRIVSAGWKGLTIEKFDMFIGDKFIGKYSIFH